MDDLSGIRVYVNKFLSTRVFQTAIGKGIIISGFLKESNNNRLACLLVKLTIIFVMRLTKSVVFPSSQSLVSSGDKA